MPVNLNDWLGDHLWAWWLAALVLLLAASLVSRHWMAYAVTAVPAAAAIAAVAWPDQFWVQAAVGLVVGVVAVVLARGWLARAAKRRDAAVESAATEGSSP